MYDKIKHCWKMGYKIPKIKEYTSISSEWEVLKLFKEVIEKELNIGGNQHEKV